MAGLDREEFAKFYRDHYRLVLTTVVRRVNGFAAAEDITAEVFRVAWQRHNRGGELTVPWLYAVVRNVVGNEYRRAARSRALTSRLQEELPAGTDGHTDDAADVRRALATLSSAEREILYLAYWDELSSQEIGEVLRISATTARVRLMRARRSLKIALDRIDQWNEEVSERG